MAPLRLPVGAEPAQAQAEHAGAQIGITLAFGQDEEATVIDDEEPAAGALAGRPAQPVLPALEMEGGGAEGEQGDPLAVEFGDIAEGLAGQAGAGQIVLLFEGAVEGLVFVLAEQTHGHAPQQVGFAELGRHRHAAVVEDGRGDVHSFLTRARPASTLTAQMKYPYSWVGGI